MVPPSFSLLVEITIKKWHWDKLPDTIDDIWSPLMTQIFLGPMVKTSQAIYIKSVLESFLCYSNAHNVDSTGWSNNVIEHLNKEEKNIGGTLGEGAKKGIIRLAKQQVDSLSLSRTVFDALNFFKNNRISVKQIRSLSNDISLTEELALKARNNIHNVALTKAVIWLYGCGIGRDLVPPNTHVIRFLNRYQNLGYGWDSSKWPSDIHAFSPCRNKVSIIAQEVSDQIQEKVTNKQVQAAIWYYQTCKGLLKKKSSKLNPKTLIDFLNHQKWTIEDLDSYIADIELIDDLTEYLYNFV